mgnify:CR=1 FL=1
MKKLPIGIQTFSKIVGDCYYADKTHFIKRLADTGEYYFLSRPRRFGKSLLVSTLKSAFSGQKELFEGLYLYDNWDWTTQWPVVHISFGSGFARSVDDLRTNFEEILYDHQKLHDIQFGKKSLKGRFSELIEILAKRYEQNVVVLIDEYDKPILDNIAHPETAAAIRDELKNLYSVIKDSDPYIKFVFITGVSKFSKVSLFSGLNNLNDITLEKRYSAICGYTQTELETVFADRLDGIDLAEMRKWYNGYNWLGEEVYNPFDVLLYLDSGEFRNYWFETGTPGFMVELLRTGRYYIPGIQHLTAGEEIVGSFDVEHVNAETLLFQTGYLTIENFEQVGAFRRYRLRYPNLEVRASLNNAILTTLVEDRLAKTQNQSDALNALMADDMERLRRVVQRFFASIPHQWYRKNQMARYEGYYASIVYCYFAALGLDVRPEETTNHGLIDLAIRFQGRIYVIEFKVVELTGKGNALQQIKDKGYAEKYSGESVTRIGVEFSSKERNIVRFEWEKG